MKRYGSSEWHGSARDGSGTISTGSGALKEAPYSLTGRIDQKPETNPEELLGAAHSGCFSASLAVVLDEAGLVAERINTEADVTLEKSPSGYSISAIQLVTRATVPGVDQRRFGELAEKARSICPVSKALNAKVSLDAMLVS